MSRADNLPQDARLGLGDIGEGGGLLLLQTLPLSEKLL